MKNVSLAKKNDFKRNFQLRTYEWQELTAIQILLNFVRFYLALTAK